MGLARKRRDNVDMTEINSKQDRIINVNVGRNDHSILKMGSYCICKKGKCFDVRNTHETFLRQTDRHSSYNYNHNKNKIHDMAEWQKDSSAE